MRQISMWRRVAMTTIIFAIVSLVSGIVWAQGIVTGNLGGTVQDSTGALISGAKVTVTEPDTNAVHQVTTNASGAFTVTDLPVGTYIVKIEYQGFSSLSLNGVHVDANHTQDLGVQKLTAGGATTTVEVSASEALLETTQAQVSTTFDTQQ